MLTRESTSCEQTRFSTVLTVTATGPQRPTFSVIWHTHTHSTTKHSIQSGVFVTVNHSQYVHIMQCICINDHSRVPICVRIVKLRLTVWLAHSASVVKTPIWQSTNSVNFCRSMFISLTFYSINGYSINGTLVLHDYSDVTV